MPLTVLSVAYPHARVGPDAVGGAEQVLSTLDRALVAKGHRSLVIAAAGSTVAGELVAIPETPGDIDAAARASAQARVRAAIAAVRARERVDVVHLHGIDCAAYLPDEGATLVTLHLPLDWYPPALFAPRPGLTLHAVSAAQHATKPPGVRLAEPIGNGVPDALFAARRTKRGFALMLGRVCPEKGVDHALRAAHAAGRTLLIGGQVYSYAAHEAYFRDAVAPLLDERRRFLGPVGFARKRRLLAAAECLLVPSLVAETASLVAMEALACGTPVIAYPNGALAEVVEHGRTGFLVSDEAEMAEAMAHAGAISAETCRAVARARFSEGRMTQAYLGLYARMAGGSQDAVASVSSPAGAPASPASARDDRGCDLHARLLVDDAALEALAPAWWALWRDSPEATPFQSPAFLLPWRRHFRPGPLASVAAFDGDRLVGLAPFWLEEESARLLPLGISLGDQLDVLVAPNRAEAAGAALVEGLAAIPGWRTLACEETPPGAAARRLPAPAGVAWEEERASACPLIPLSAADAETLACVPADRRRKLRRAHRLAEEAGGLAIADMTDDPGGFFSRLVALHETRWRERGEDGVLADETAHAFHAEAVVGLARAGLARLFLARIGGRDAAAYYGLQAKGRAYAYLGGFDTAFAQESPGALVMEHAIRRSAAEGAREYDLLRGRESYKYAFGARDRWNARLTLRREGGREGAS